EARKRNAGAVSSRPELHLEGISEGQRVSRGWATVCEPLVGGYDAGARGAVPIVHTCRQSVAYWSFWGGLQPTRAPPVVSDDGCVYARGARFRARHDPSASDRSHAGRVRQPLL